MYSTNRMRLVEVTAVNGNTFNKLLRGDSNLAIEDIVHRCTNYIRVTKNDFHFLRGDFSIDELLFYSL